MYYYNFTIVNAKIIVGIYRRRDVLEVHQQTLLNHSGLMFYFLSYY